MHNRLLQAGWSGNVPNNICIYLASYVRKFNFFFYDLTLYQMKLLWLRTAFKFWHGQQQNFQEFRQLVAY
jgi:hypothetical protein